MSLVQALRVVQETYRFLPEDALLALADRLGVKPYRLQEVASFFPHFHREEPPVLRIGVCRDMACHLHGAAALRAELQNRPEAADPRRLIVEGVSCLGRCDRAPVVCVERSEPPAERPHPMRVAARAALAGEAEEAHFDFWAGRQPAELRPLVNRLIEKDGEATFDSDERYPTARNEWLIDSYRKDETPFQAARRLAEEMRRDGSLLARPGPPPESPPKPPPPPQRIDFAWTKPFLERHYSRSVCELLEQLDRAGLRGMGGAGQLAFEKWFDVLTAPGTVRYVVANGDESEPGTFKDRELLVRTPHLVVEGVILAGLLLGAERGFIYVRHEYAEGIQRLRAAIRSAEALGVCGPQVLGTSRAFPLEVFVSPGGYICGEQSALLEAMEDRRAEPRNRPPELATNGLHDQPTLVNNVETLAWLPAIALKGGAWYAALGANGGKGRRLFSISGDVARPGVYELPIGVPLSQLLDCAGGMRDPAQALKAVATSGPSAGFVPAQLREGSLLDLPLDIDAFRKARLMLGAGLVVYDATRNLGEQALNCTEFFRNESCGKCVPCRLGSEKLVQIGTGLMKGILDAAGLEAQDGLIRQLTEVMTMSSICGLGTVAPAPLTSLLRHFRADLPRRSPASGGGS